MWLSPVRPCPTPSECAAGGSSSSSGSVGMRLYDDGTLAATAAQHQQEQEQQLDQQQPRGTAAGASSLAATDRPRAISADAQQVAEIVELRLEARLGRLERSMGALTAMVARMEARLTDAAPNPSPFNGRPKVVWQVDNGQTAAGSQCTSSGGGGSGGSGHSGGGLRSGGGGCAQPPALSHFASYRNDKMTDEELAEQEQEQEMQEMSRLRRAGGAGAGGTGRATVTIGALSSSPSDAAPAVALAPGSAPVPASATAADVAAASSLAIVQEQPSAAAIASGAADETHAVVRAATKIRAKLRAVGKGVVMSSRANKSFGGSGSSADDDPLGSSSIMSGLDASHELFCDLYEGGHAGHASLTNREEDEISWGVRPPPRSHVAQRRVCARP